MKYIEIPFAKRFSDALEFIVNVKPPENLVADWLNHGEMACDLQQWVGKYAPNWCQNIAVLDAAHLMASNPCEGEM